MANEPSNDDVLKGVDPARRDFLRRIVAGTAFTVPLMASFSMEGLSINTAEASCAYVPYTYCSETPYAGPTLFEVPLFFQEKKIGEWIGRVVEGGCTLEYLFRETSVDVCHFTLAQIFGGLDGLVIAESQARAGQAFEALRSRVGSGIPWLAPTHPGVQSRNGFILSQLSLPAAFLFSAGGTVLLFRRGRISSGPGFDLTLLLEALAAGEFLILLIVKKGAKEGLVFGSNI